MKKFFLMAVLALSMSAFAQRVTPLNITLAEVKLDSLRTLYLAEPIMYRASLDAIAQALEKNDKEIKAAKTELKVEKQHAKEMGTSLKKAETMVASLKKLYGKEENELRNMSKTVEKQMKTLGKQNELNDETRNLYRSFLEKQQQELNYSLRDVAERARAISDLETSIQNAKSNLSQFEQQANLKESELKFLETQLKERQKLVKEEQKAAKSL
jgi:chromosome segregation ATPase